MPVLKHAKKKLRQDHKRTVDNLRIKKIYKKLIKDAKAAGTPDAVNEAFSAIDKAAKKQVIHRNKAARLKASLAKSMNSEESKETAVKKTAVKKTPVKKASKKKTASSKKK